MLTDECRASTGIKIAEGNKVLEGNLPQYPFVHHKPHITWNRIQFTAWEVRD
jgi:hypothetical protein